MWKKCRAVLLVALSVAVVGAGSLQFTAQASNLSDLKDQYSALEEKRAQTQQELNKLKAEQADKEAYTKTLSAQIQTIESQMDVLDGQMNKLDQSIFTTQKKINQKEKDIEKNYQEFKDRLRVMYMCGDASTLQILFSSDDFNDLFSRAELMKDVAQYDRKLIAKLKSDKEELAKSKEALDKQKSDLESQKQTVAAKKSELSKLYEENKAYMDGIQSDIDKQKAADAALEGDLDSIESEIQAIIAAQAKKNTQSSGGSGSSGGGSGSATVTGTGQFLWPVPDCHVVSSEYKWRWGRLHKGIDIANGNTYGLSIVAADSGTVIWAAYDSSGYGNYVMIDHHNGFVTLYAHCSSLLVSQGQTVTRGQVIAKVGNTGNSYGAHCHFEVRVNGTPQNPRNYL